MSEVAAQVIARLTQINGEPLGLGSVLTAHAAAEPDKPALTIGSSTLTRRELDARAARLAALFASKGLRQGNLVAIILPNDVEFVAAVLASWRLGATPLPVSSRLAPSELAASLQLAQPGLVIGMDPTGIVDAPWVASEEMVLAQVSQEECDPLVECAPGAWKAILSGGSTGRPKIILDPRPSRLQAHTLNATIRSDDVVLVPGPMYHNLGFKCCMNGLLAGTHVIVMPRFDAREALELIKRYRVSWTSLVPTMMNRIWKLPERTEYGELPSLRILFHTAAPCPPWLKEAYIDWLGQDRVFELYGGTENYGFAAITGSEWLQRRGSVGRALPGYSFRVLDEEGRDLPAGDVGEIYMRAETGPGSTYKYLGAAACRSRDGWETLGDLGYMDADGYLYFCDRETDMIVRAGSNVYPAEVEAAIDSHPRVHSSAVIGLPDDDLGARLHAVVYAAGEVSETELAKHVEALLARYKRPTSYEFVDSPVRDDAGKVRRSALRSARVGRFA